MHMFSPHGCSHGSVECRSPVPSQCQAGSKDRLIEVAMGVRSQTSQTEWPTQWMSTVRVSQNLKNQATAFRLYRNSSVFSLLAAFDWASGAASWTQIAPGHFSYWQEDQPVDPAQQTGCASSVPPKHASGGSYAHKKSRQGIRRESVGELCSEPFRASGLRPRHRGLSSPVAGPGLPGHS